MKRINFSFVFIVTLTLTIWSNQANDSRMAQPQHEILKELVDQIENGKYGTVDSVLIQLDGELVFERYFNDFDRDKLHFIASVNKSILSASIGIARDQGKIKSIKEKVLDFFPEYKDVKNLDERKRNITLKDLLTMSSGLSWEGDNIDMPKIIESEDWIKSVLDLPMDHDPGTYFNYCTGHRYLTDGILQKTTGLNAKEFAIKYILTPLGITNYYWKTYEPNNIARSGGDFRFRPIDLLKFGQLYLNEGKWNDKCLIPKEWVKLSTSAHIKANERNDYGFQWWHPNKDHPVSMLTGENDAYYASGAGGQKIWIVPHLNLVAVSTARNRKQENTSILWDYIIRFAQDTKK